ncbi:MAG: alpha/beta fold hydrolase [Planctomycetota bacterium]|jgi:pimeloyl-ACP methyl ester carboxylesterase
MKLQLLSALLCISLLPGCGGKNSAPQSHYADYNGHKVHYQVEGSGDKTIVFIHGWSCDTEFWKYQTPAFKDDYRVILIDLPGHGKSDAPEMDYTMVAFADAVKAVLDHSSTEKAVVAGHSMGFAVACQFAIKYPTNAAGLCSVDGFFLRIPADPEEFATLKQNIEMVKGGLKMPDRQAFLNMFLESMYTEKTTPQIRQFILERMSATAKHVGDSAMDDLFNLDNWQDLPVLDVPTLAVYVSNPHQTEADRAFLREKFTNLDYHEIADYSHFFMLETPDYFNTTLKAFLAM